MSDFCRKHSLNPHSSAAGFTLLEVLVVLALVGLLTAVSLPQFGVVRDRLTFTLNRDSFERELGGLSYQAFKEGRALILAGKYPRSPNERPAESSPFSDNVSSFLDNAQLRTLQPILALDAALNLPEDWRVTVEDPIIYQASGFCGGGKVSLLIGRAQYVYDLKAPTCQAVLAR